MGYNFSKTSNSLIATLDTEDGKYDEHIIECFQPNILLGQDRIVLNESSLRVQDFLFESIGQINGETPTNLIDGFEMLESFIKSIFVSGTGGSDVGYKIYRAIITQNDINDLQFNVLENTIGIVTVNQFSTGIFLIKLPEGTDLYKVFLPNNLIKGHVPGFCTLDVDYFDTYSNSDVMLRTYENINNGFVFTDFILNKTPLEIIVYD